MPGRSAPCTLVVLILASSAFADVEDQLKRAGDNRPQLEAALKATPESQLPGMRFLIEHMPETDLKTLKADFLTANVALAYKAREIFPWAKAVPEEIFLNDVLPYANVDEKRDAWRSEFLDLCGPMVKDCKTATEAVQKLNTDLFPKLKLGYSKQRKAPNQSPKESIEQGKASCTGLSIVLADACRAVGIPARLVGTPLWTNKTGNHTWVEIWDGDWHFTGACEPDKAGLDRGWFTGNAAEAKRDSFEHAIYAASFKKTELHFPLVWARRDKSVPGVNVTDRYARKAAAGTVRVAVRVVGPDKKRVVRDVSVTVVGEPKPVAEGKSRGESADLNDLLTFDLNPDREYVIRVGDVEAKVTPKPGTTPIVEVPLR